MTLLHCLILANWEFEFDTPALAYLGNKQWKYLPNDVKLSDIIFTYKNELHFGTVIDAIVGSGDCISQEWGF